MDLTQIRFFLTLAETLNFTRAAELCHVTQPALTKSIQRLEGELGGPLLLRERSHTRLTPLGRAVLPLLQQTFDAAERARQGALRFQHQDSPRLRIGFGHRVEPAILTPLVQHVVRRFPDLEITTRQGSFTMLNEGLLASRLDLAFTEEGERLTERANRWQVFADPIVAVFPASHDQAVIGAIEVDQLRHQVLVGRAGAASDEAEGDTALEDAYALAPAIRHRATSETHVFALVQAVGGVALSTARRVLPTGMRSHMVEPRQTIPIWVAALAGRPMSRAADCLLRLARARDWEDLAC